MKAQEFLRPGDCLLYRASSPIGYAIGLKTWCYAATHCEGYIGDGVSVASRGPQDGQGGVECYPLRLADLSYILRPIGPFSVARAQRWFAGVRGQRYDFWGLMRFFAIGRGKQDRMFCSEFLTRWYRAGGLEPFHRSRDADTISPAQFLQSPEYDQLEVLSGGEIMLVQTVEWE